jgi:geranylgeranylglycerol-phosphate geranylgeranyltransferase
VLFTLLFIAISVSYSTWLKKYGLLGNIGVSMSYPAAILLGGFVVGYQTAEVFITVGSFGLLIFFAALGREVLKGVMDMEGDKLQGVQTVAVRLGPKNAAVITFILMIISTFFVPIPLLVGLNGRLTSSIIYAGFMILMIIVNFRASLALVLDPSKETGIKGRKQTKIAFWFGVLGYFFSALAL